MRDNAVRARAAHRRRCACRCRTPYVMAHAPCVLRRALRCAGSTRDTCPAGAMVCVGSSSGACVRSAIPCTVAAPQRAAGSLAAGKGQRGRSQRARGSGVASRATLTACRLHRVHAYALSARTGWVCRRLRRRLPVLSIPTRDGPAGRVARGIVRAPHPRTQWDGAAACAAATAAAAAAWIGSLQVDRASAEEHHAAAVGSDRAADTDRVRRALARDRTGTQTGGARGRTSGAQCGTHGVIGVPRSGGLLLYVWRAPPHVVRGTRRCDDRAGTAAWRASSLGRRHTRADCSSTRTSCARRRRRGSGRRSSCPSPCGPHPTLPCPGQQRPARRCEMQTARSRAAMRRAPYAPRAGALGAPATMSVAAAVGCGGEHATIEPCRRRRAPPPCTAQPAALRRTAPAPPPSPPHAPRRGPAAAFAAARLEARRLRVYG